MERNSNSLMAHRETENKIKLEEPNFSFSLIRHVNGTDINLLRIEPTNNVPVFNTPKKKKSTGANYLD